MQRDDALKVMTLGLRVGEVMLESTMAVSDVEDAVRRIMGALGLEGCEVSITLDVITLNYLHPSLEVPMTLMRVVRIGEPRLDRIVALEHLSRRIQAGELDLQAASREIEHFDEVDTRYPRLITTTGALASVAAWVIFAGGGLFGALAGVLAAVVIDVVLGPLSRTRIPAVFATFLSAVVVVAVPHLFAAADLSIALSPAVVGGLFPLLPGGALVASVTDGLSGAPISSLAKGLEAAIVAVAVALGTGSALTLAAELDIVSTAARPEVGTLLAVGSGGLAVAGLAMSRSMPLRFVPTTAALGMVSWWVNSTLVAEGYEPKLTAFIAASVLGLGGQLLARLQRTTPIVHTTSAIYVLVPGFVFYISMAAFAAGDSAAAMPVLIDALSRAAAIAAGVALGVAIGRSVPAPRPRVALWRRSSRRRPGAVRADVGGRGARGV
jgi:uncharacterized membrane protein YjjP (DUF1212 family)